MKVYLDSSVILRYVLQQAGIFPGWGKWEVAVTGEISRVEGYRAIDRVRLEGRVNDLTLMECHERLEKILGRVDAVELDRRILHRASQAFPTVIGALDAIHVVSAVLWKEENDQELLFLTHDNRQGLAARSMGLKTEGFEI